MKKVSEHRFDVLGEVVTEPLNTIKLQQQHSEHEVVVIVWEL